MSKLLSRHGVLTEMDASALATYCQVWSRWQYAEEQLQKYGPVILSPQNKFPIQSPYLAIANRTIEQLQKLLVEFGMTPSSRSRILVAPESEPNDLAAFQEEGRQIRLQSQRDRAERERAASRENE